MLSTKKRCRKAKRTRGGSTAIVAPAMTRFVFMRAPIVAEQAAEADDDRILVGMALQHGQRPEIAVPVIDEGEKRQRGDGRRNARRNDEEHDLSSEAPSIRPASIRSSGTPLDELAQEEDAERVGEVRRDHAGKPAIDVQIADQPVERDKRHDRRQEHRGDHGREQDVPGREIGIWRRRSPRAGW